MLIDKNQSRFLKAPALGMEFLLGIIKYLFIHGLLLGGEALPPQLSLGQLPPHAFPQGQSGAKQPGLGNLLHGSKPQFTNFKAELMMLLPCKGDRVYMIKAGEIQ